MTPSRPRLVKPTTGDDRIDQLLTQALRLLEAHVTPQNAAHELVHRALERAAGSNYWSPTEARAAAREAADLYGIEWRKTHRGTPCECGRGALCRVEQEDGT